MPFPIMLENGIEAFSLGTLLKSQSSQNNNGNLNTVPVNQGHTSNQSGNQILEGGVNTGQSQSIDCYV
jgi:hypothetical protein